MFQPSKKTESAKKTSPIVTGVEFRLNTDQPNEGDTVLTVPAVSKSVQYRKKQLEVLLSSRNH